jgi:hypothetical protein
MGHEERLPPPSPTGRCGFRKRPLAANDWAASAYEEGLTRLAISHF